MILNKKHRLQEMDYEFFSKWNLKEHLDTTEICIYIAKKEIRLN